MQFDCEIEVVEPKTIKELFHPYICFKIVQTNMTGQLMHENEIDERIDVLIQELEEIRKNVKNKFKKAMQRHDRLVAELSLS